MKPTTTKRTRRKKRIRKDEGEYTHTTIGNTILSFYCPSKLADVVDLKRGKIPRSVFLVDTLSVALGVKLPE